MSKRCMYCSSGIEDERAVDICDNCGQRVWGNKMFRAIKKSMRDAKEKGDLFQGSIIDSFDSNIQKV